MPTYIVNVSLGIFCYNENYLNMAAFCPTYAIESGNPNPVDTYVEAGDCLSDFWDIVRAVVSDSAFYYENHWRPLAGDWPYTGEDDSQAVNPQGNAPGLSQYYKTLMVRKFTGDPARYTKGRAYIPYIGAEWAEATVIDPDDAGLAAVATAFATPFTRGATTITPVKFNKSTGNWDSVVQAKMSPFLAFQRRRNMSRAYYDLS